jgi:hypothetical protein
MTDAPSTDPLAAWQQLVAALGAAGERMDKATKTPVSAEERADGFRALARALANQLGRLEVDDARPELVPFNLWRQKFYMDNPDYLYWVAEIAPGGRYRIDGRADGAVFLSINVYAAAGLSADTVARITSDDLVFDAERRFSVTLGGAKEDAEGAWLPLPANANMVWVRQFFDEPQHLGRECTITRIDPCPPTPMIEAGRFTRRLSRLAGTLDMASRVIAKAGSSDAEPRNAVREWSEMQGGAVFTEPGIHYQRGAWDLAPDEALVIEGRVAPARHWTALLYSRYLNSLDARNRRVSLTGAHVKTDADGHFRLVLAGEDPNVPNWLDTEGRPFGIFVIRWLQPSSPPVLPTARVVKLADLREEP